MKNLTRFDIGCIIAFVVISLLGGGAWYYLSGQLDAAKGEVSAAAGDFDQYSKRQPYLPVESNLKTLTENIATLQARLDPLVKKLQAPGNKLPEVTKEDTVTWKHELDAEVGRLNDLAKVHGVTVPKNFYYSFSKYLNTNPTDEYTVVLRKQLLGVEEIANILIGAPVHEIGSFRRTYEENPEGGSSTDPDALTGRAETAPGGVYISYPFEIQFSCDATGFRKVINGLQNSPYVFVIRNLEIRNTTPTSPQKGDLDKNSTVTGPTPTGGNDISTPGAVATAAPHAPRGPQFLFGNEDIQVKARVDMIEWLHMAEADQFNNTQGGGHGNRRGARGAGGRGGGYGGGRGGDNE